jgi:peptidoglycan/LPS O-acetylase OafA/YrhL
LPRGDSLAPIPLAYLTVYLGLLDPPRVKWFFRGDYSYGLFLYGFPIEQAVASAGPWAQHWYVSVALAYPLTAAVAVASWWCIEKPVLSQKATLRRLEDLYLVIARFAARRHPT